MGDIVLSLLAAYSLILGTWLARALRAERRTGADAIDPALRRTTRLIAGGLLLIALLALAAIIIHRHGD